MLESGALEDDECEECEYYDTEKIELCESVRDVALRLERESVPLLEYAPYLSLERVALDPLEDPAHRALAAAAGL